MHVLNNCVKVFPVALPSCPVDRSAASIIYMGGSVKAFPQDIYMNPSQSQVTDVGLKQLWDIRTQMSLLLGFTLAGRSGSRGTRRVLVCISR